MPPKMNALGAFWITDRFVTGYEDDGIEYVKEQLKKSLVMRI